MDGLINLNKPRGLSSAKALYRVRRLIGQRKSGHAGTLDPLANGVLLLCLGGATRLVESLMALPKVYRATARLDVTSASFDSERELMPVPCAAPPERPAVLGILPRFEGVIEQTPPAVSAIKVGGRPAYRLERAGRPPDLKPRPVTVYWIELRRYQWPEIEFDVACGRGTYVRALIRDIGQALGTGGCLTALTRLSVGPWHLEQAYSLEGVERVGVACVVPLERVRETLAAPSAAPPRPAPE